MILGKSIAIDCGGLKKQRGIANYIENIIIGLEKQKLKIEWRFYLQLYLTYFYDFLRNYKNLENKNFADFD